MKVLKFLLSLAALVALCVITSIYIVELHLQIERSKRLGELEQCLSKPSGRYKIIFGEIVEEQSGPDPGRTATLKEQKKVCFLLDTAEGDVWLYEDFFYVDHETILTRKGFSTVERGYITHTHKLDSLVGEE